MLDLWYDFWNWITPVNPAVPALAFLSDFQPFVGTSFDGPVALSTVDAFALDTSELT